MTRSYAHTLWMLALIAALASPTQAQTSGPQTGASYFHEAAQQYLDANLQQALATVNDGLRIAPNDARLRALREKIRQQRQRQQSGSESGSAQQPSPQGGRSPQDASNRDGEQRGQGQQPSPRTESSSNQQQGAQGQSEGQERQEDPSAEDAGERGSASVATRGGQEQGPELSQAQAARILRALEAQEKQLLRQVQKRRRIPQRIVKEW